MERWGWLLGAESLGEVEGLGGAGNHLHGCEWEQLVEGRPQ